MIAGTENSASRIIAKGFGHRSLALRPLRFVLLACGLIALLLGLWTGMARVGIGQIGGAPQFVEFHGALMICGFFGTLICMQSVSLAATPSIAALCWGLGTRIGLRMGHHRKQQAGGWHFWS